MYNMTLSQTIVMAIVQSIAIIIFIFILVPLTTFAERKILGYLQDRLGATRIAGSKNGITGYLNKKMWQLGKIPVLSILRGLPMFIGDIIKLLVKEDIVPSKSDKLIFIAAPALSMVASLVTFSAISFYPGTLFIFPQFVPIIGGLPFAGSMIDANVGLLFILGITSIGVYGIILGAWASNSRYPLLGGLRSSAQIISYEVPLTLSLMVPVLLSSSLNFNEITCSIATKVHIIATPILVVGFLIYFTCGLAETNRMPFDMPEAENELVAGFHTEYSGMKFGFFYLAEYINMITVSAIASSFFLGGPFLLPFGLQNLIPMSMPIIGKPSVIWLILKILFMLFTFIWIRGTVPRYRYDQIMSIAWKYLIPIALINMLIAATIRYLT